MSVFGGLSHAGQLEDDLLDHLKLWLPTYLAECERQFDTTLPDIRSYSVVSDYDRLPQQALPVLIIESAGTEDEPENDGDRNYWARYEVRITVETAAADPLPTRRQAQTYGLALQALLLQKPAVSENVSVIDFGGVSFAAESVEKRWRASSTSTFLIEHRDFLNSNGGPTEPDLNPADWPEITEVITTIEKEELA